MNENTKNDRLIRARLIFSVITTAFAVLAGIAYIFAACHLYFTGGDTPYTRERVGEYLLWLLPLSLLFIASVITSAILGSEKKVLAGKACKTKLTKSRPRILLSVRISVAAVALALVIYGAVSGGMTDVLGKAVKICTECIGLG